MQEYIQAVKKCVEQCKEMLVLESEKRKALATNIGKDIECVVKNQQAAIMKLETLEQQRMQAQHALGYAPNMTASDILRALPDSPDKTKLAQLIAELRQLAEDLKEQNRDCLDLAKLDLRLIESLKADVQQPPPESGVYSRTQATKPVASKFNSSF